MRGASELIGPALIRQPIVELGKYLIARAIGLPERYGTVKWLRRYGDFQECWGECDMPSQTEYICFVDGSGEDKLQISQS